MPVSNKPLQKGFTLVELLIVVIILAVLASVAIPQFSSSTDDAKEAVLDATLTELRNAIELYYHQHGEYPSALQDGSGNAQNTAAAFISQLTQYTDGDGAVATVKSSTYKYGPYLKKQAMPENPIDGLSAMVISTTGDISETGTNAGGWWFDNVSGKFMANLNSHNTR